MTQKQKQSPTRSKKRWVIWGILVLAYVVIVFFRMNLSVSRIALIENHQLSASAFGSLAAVFLYAYCLGQIPTGFLADTIGPRMTVSLGLLIVAAGSFLFGAAANAGELFTARFLIGIGSSVCYICIMKIQSQWFHPYEFSALSGACILLGNLGSLLAYTPMVFLINALGFPQSFYLFGLITCMVSLAAFLLVRNKPQIPSPFPIGLVEATWTRELTLKQGIKKILTNFRNIPLLILYCSITSVYFAFASTWGVSYLQAAYALPLHLASHYFSFFIVGYMSGCFVLGYISDKLRKRKTVLLFATSGQLGSWGLFAYSALFLQSAPALLPLLLILGFFMGAVPPLIALIKESNPLEYTGITIGLINTCAALSGALATKYFGVLLDCYAELPLLEQYQHGFKMFFGLLITAVLAALCCQDSPTGLPPGSAEKSCVVLSPC